MSKIEWIGEGGKTWNPWWGCGEIGPECGQYAPTGTTGGCYAARLASRGLHAIHQGVATDGRWTGLISRSSATVWQAPFTWRRPCLVFTCSMSDFWHEDVPLAWLDEALSVIDGTPHLTYQILTKRPGNIARRLRDLNRRLPANVWLGATIGHERSLPLLKPLIAVPATLRFLSCEPLLTPLVPRLSLDGIGWVITGGQSGPGAGWTDAFWVRGIRDLCQEKGVPYFHKQWGTWASNPTPRDQELDLSAKGGATLDGKLWRAFPA